MNLNARYIFPKYETVKNGDILAITVSPSDVYQCWDSENRLNDWRSWMALLLAKIRKSCFVQASIECSPSGYLHFHGTIEIIDKKFFYLYSIHELKHENTVCIKLIDDTTKWNTYCVKQSGDWGSLRSPDVVPISNSMFIYDQLSNKSIGKKKRGKARS